MVLTDYSEAQDGSIIGWLDGDTYYISSGSSDIKIKAGADASEMFYDFYSESPLKTIDLSNLDTSSATTMYKIFAGLVNLTEIKFGDKFDTSNVTDMSWMFIGCTSLTSLDLSNFDFSKVTSMGFMFRVDNSLTTIIVKDEATKTKLLESDADIPTSASVVVKA